MKFYNHDELKLVSDDELVEYRSAMLHRHAGNPVGSTSYSESNSVLMAIEYEFKKRAEINNEKEFQKVYIMNWVIIAISLVSLVTAIIGIILQFASK